MKPHLTFQEYEVAAAKPAFYPNIGDNPIYPALGLSGELGEVLGKALPGVLPLLAAAIAAGNVAELVKKVERDGGGVISPEVREKLKAELGDLTMEAREIGYSLADVAQGNLDKLTSRAQRGVLGGSGDDR